MKCPNCGNENHGKMMGHEIPGIYDGVLFWSCMLCGRAWPRDFGDWDRLNELSGQHAATANMLAEVAEQEGK